jgi:hypothetical protein
MDKKKRSLDKKIQDQIDLIIPPAKKELDFIKRDDKDWSKIEDLEERETIYQLQDMLNSRNIAALTKFHDIAKDDLAHPDVKLAINLLLEFYYILESRYNSMEERFDWTAYSDKDGETAEKRQEPEIKFQHGVLKDYSKFKEDLRKINFGDDTISIDIPVHGDKPIPIIMRYMIEQRYPEIKEFIKSKKQK